MRSYSAKTRLIYRSLAAFFFTIILTLPSWSMGEKNTDHSNWNHQTEAIDFMWSGHRVKPYLLTRGEHQFLAYYDANRQMTIAHRHLTKPWRYFKVDSWLGWDSHNYVTLEIDSEGYLHVMGNMHGDPMEYFRSERPYSVRTLRRQSVMVDVAVESRMTYPMFMLNKKGELLVKYRDGGSGNGNEIYNIYDTNKKRWSRLHSNQFVSGEGQRNAYFDGPHLGPDGNFHLVWVWRETGDASTNNNLSYARSVDLVNWTDSNGKPLELPIVRATADIVDPVPEKGGMINGNVKVGFDANNKPVVSYHKYDEDGNTQIYIAVKEGEGWQSQRVSDWKGFRWDFGGFGSLGRFPITVTAPKSEGEDLLTLTIRKNDDWVRFLIDSATLKTVDMSPTEIYPKIIDDANLASNKHLANNPLPLELLAIPSAGDQGVNGVYYYLSWNSQPGNRDIAHRVISDPSVLLLHELKK